MYGTSSSFPPCVWALGVPEAGVVQYAQVVGTTPWREVTFLVNGSGLLHADLPIPCTLHLLDSTLLPSC
jgi:hypothetical protein